MILGPFPPVMSPLAHMSAEKATVYADALADCACWFRGFLMGKGEDAAEMPPGFRKLGELGAALKDHAEMVRRNGAA